MKSSSIKISIFFIIICIVTLVPIQAQYYYTSKSFTAESFFYTGKNYGSESMFNPINVVLNNGYDIIQLGNKPRTIFDYP